MFILSDNQTIVAIDCNASQNAATYSGIKDLGCESALSTAAMTSITASATVLDIAEPLVPALNACYVPAVTGVSIFCSC